MLTTLLSAPATACFFADHHRKIVLGETDQGLLILELALSRRDEELSIFWYGEIFLRGSTETMQLSEEKIAEVRIAEEELESRSRGWIEQALRIARRDRSFLPAGLPTYEFCDEDRVCGPVSLHSSNGRSRLQVHLVHGEPAEVTLEVPPPPFANPNLTIDNPRLVGLFIYRVEERSVLVVDLGEGDEDRTWNAPAMWPPCGCVTIEDCVPETPTMHHGKQFQVVIPLATVVPTAEPVRDSFARVKETSLPRIDGVYATPPICDREQGWSRTFLRFLEGHVVREVVGNVSPRSAFAAMAESAHFLVPTGSFSSTNSSITVALEWGDDRWSYRLGPSQSDGHSLTIREVEGVDGAKSRATVGDVLEFFQFVPSVRVADEEEARE